MLSRRGVRLIIYNTVLECRLLSNYTLLRSVRAGAISTTSEGRQTNTITDKDVNNGTSVTTDYKNIIVFGSKKTWELFRSLFILKASSVGFFVTHSESIFLLSRRWLWQCLSDTILSKTFYGHFAAGVNIETSRDTVERLRKSGIRAMLMVPIETAEYANEAEEEEGLAKNLEIIKGNIRGTALLDDHGFSQVKLTALCSKNLLLEMNKYLIAHECDHNEPGGWDVKTMLKYLEDERFEDINIPELGEKMNEELQVFLKGLDELGKLSTEKNVRMMIDAEQSYIQAALGYLVLLLQAKFNKRHPLVYNTYQCYRKDTLDRIKGDHALGVDIGFKIAGKLVRGAYMVEERKLAAEEGYDDPINDTFDDTSAMYHSCVDYLLPMIVEGESGTMVASHNEDTVDFVKDRMNSYNIPKDSNYLCFGQLFGMCDHVSYHLAQQSYTVFKSVPYGEIDDTLPYLARRAQENRSVIHRTKFERFLIRQELKRRAVNIFSKTPQSNTLVAK